MRFRNRLFVVAFIALAVIGVLYIGKKYNQQPEETDTGRENIETVTLWYSDDSFTDFFINAAVAFHEKHSGIRVIPTLVDSSEYLEVINRASVYGDNFPDLFILSNDSLEKAYLAGLASEVSDPGNALKDGFFPKASLDAVTYHNKYVGYPLTFETSVLLYNKTYLKNWADKINAGGKASEGEGVSAEDMEMDGETLEEYTDESHEEEEEAKVVSYEDYIPETFDDLLAFADSYEPEANVASIIKWDVSDVFYNYYFVGNYMIVGGDAGDDVQNINIKNNSAISCMQIYQNLNQFFSIDANDSKAEDVLKEFIDGKLVYTIATSNALAEIKAARDKATAEYNNAVRDAKAHNKELAENSDAEGELIDIDSIEKPMEYGFAVIPELSAEYRSRSLSVTEAVVVNGYSEKKTAANRFAAFLSSTYSDQIYPRTGKLAASLDANYTDEGFVTYQKEYARSIPLPKIVETSNLWVQLEIAFTKIWQGEDAAGSLNELDQQIRSQLSGR